MKYAFLTGSYADRQETGVCRVSFDPAAGFAIEKAGSGYANPSFVLPHPNKKRFYAVRETGDGAVVEGDMDTLAPLPGEHPTGGDSPCHLSLSGDLKRLYAANYMSGSLAAYELDDEGRIIRRTDLARHEGHGPNPDRQEHAHAHFSMALDGALLVCDLGTDAIVMYADEGGILRETGRVAMPAGCGPRHLAASDRHPGRLYCVAELAGRVYQLVRTEGGYEIASSVSILPEGFTGANTAAAIRFMADGALLLASNRGHDSIAVMPVGADGGLGAPVISPCVAEPRDFAICGEYVLAASQRDSVIRAYRLDRETLRLEDAGMGLELGHPVCLASI